MKSSLFFKKLDRSIICLFCVLIIFGWINIFASIYDVENGTFLDIFDTSQRYGMQFIWILGAILVAILCLLVDSKVYSVFAWLIYLATILSLLAVLVFGINVNGSKSWFDFAGIRLQPAEFAKIACSLALARIMSLHDFKLKTFRGLSTVLGIILIPAALILLEPETGLALVFAAFFLVFYREGLSGWVVIFGIFTGILFVLSILWEKTGILILITAVCALAYGLFLRKWRYLWGAAALFTVCWWLLSKYLLKYLQIGNDILFLLLLLPFVLFGCYYAFRSRIRSLWAVIICLCVSIVTVYSINYFVNSVLQPYQTKRIHILLGMEEDLQGAGYNVHQSKVAVGSGGWVGKGFLKGTQTRYNFVPEQTTDFIFCTIGEEWGFLGSCVLIILFLILFYRILLIAERQKDSFVRIYGYCVASCLFFHFFVNIGMTIGLMPVIGIPLPFISYGGSSLWAFTILLFVLLKLDATRQ